MKFKTVITNKKRKKQYALANNNQSPNALQIYHKFIIQKRTPIKSQMLLGLTFDQWRALVAGALVMLVQGSLYVFGTLTAYIASYLYYKGDSKIEINDLQIIVTISVLCVNVGMIFPRFKMFTFSNRIACLISMIGVALSVFTISFSESFALYIVIYGIIFGLFIGFGYVAPLKNCYEHIPDRKGLGSGVCIMGFGLGALLFNLILLQLMNPGNEPLDKKTHKYTQGVANNLPFALRVMSAIYLVLGMIGVFLISPPKNNDEQSTQQSRKQSLLHPQQSIESQNSFDQNQQAKPEQKEVAKVEEQEEISFKDLMIKKKIIYLMMILGFTMPFGGFVAFYYKEYGLTEITDDRYFAILGSIGSIMNGLSRMFWGTMMDKFSFKAIIYIFNVLFIIACSTIYFAVQSEFLYVIVILMTYCCYGGNFGIYPTQTVRILGAKVGGKCYWIIFSGFGVGAVLQFLIHYIFVNILGNEGFKYCFIFFGVLLVVGSIVSFLVDFEYHPSELKYIKGLDLKGHERIVNSRKQQ